MTIKELSELSMLRKEHAYNLAYMQKLKDEYCSTNESMILQKIKALQELLNADDEQILGKICEIEKYIQNIDDSYVRLIIKYKYIDCHSWARVAVLIGGGNTKDSVRMAVKRYLSTDTENS
jgi:hypothetical protein